VEVASAICASFNSGDSKASAGITLLGRRFDRPIELSLSRLICVQKIFHKAARPRLKVFAIEPNFPPPLTLLGFKPTKHRFTPMASQLGQSAAGASKFI
jgi:hypothetical protein